MSHLHHPMFKTDLILHPLPNRVWMIAMPFVVQTKTAGEIIVPAGFMCDLNSIPQFLWFVSTPADYPEAGVVHDYCYHGTKQYSRAQADAIYREILEALEMGSVRRNLRYAALRVFGGLAYKGDKE